MQKMLLLVWKCYRYDPRTKKMPTPLLYLSFKNEIKIAFSLPFSGPVMSKSNTNVYEKTNFKMFRIEKPANFGTRVSKGRMFDGWTTEVRIRDSDFFSPYKQFI